MAPLKKNPALLSSGEPANSSRLKGPFCGRQLEAVDDRAGLGDAHGEVVERGVVVDVRRLADQAVIGEDLDARVRSLLQGVGEGGAVDGGDHEGLGALRDHVLDLVELGRDVVLGVLEVGLIAGRLQRLDEVVAVRDPAGGGLGRHRDADEAACLGSHGLGRGHGLGAGPRWQPGPRWPREPGWRSLPPHAATTRAPAMKATVRSFFIGCCTPPLWGGCPTICVPRSPQLAAAVPPARWWSRDDSRSRSVNACRYRSRER